MIESSGQILTGRAAEDLTNAIEVVTGSDKFHRTRYKAVMAADAPNDVIDFDIKGTWAKIATAGNEDKFLGIVGDDTSPHANTIADANDIVSSRKPVLDWYSSRTFLKGDLFTIERNGIIPVIAAGAISKGDLIKLANGGKFQVTTDLEDAVGRAYEDAAADGDVFRAMIKAL